VDPRHFGTDPDPRISITDLRIRIPIPIEGANKNKFLFKVFCLLFFQGTFTSVFKDKKSKRSHKIVEIKVFLLFFLLIEGSGPYKLWRTRIHSTGSLVQSFVLHESRSRKRSSWPPKKRKWKLYVLKSWKLWWGGGFSCSLKTPYVGLKRNNGICWFCQHIKCPVWIPLVSLIFRQHSFLYSFSSGNPNKKEKDLDKEHHSSISSLLLYLSENPAIIFWPGFFQGVITATIPGKYIH
jgi:hypothetical protein